MKENPKLNQVVALEKGAKSEYHSQVTKAHRKSSQRALFEWFSKTYQPKDEDGDRFPDESHRVQARVNDSIEEVREVAIQLLDNVATKDCGNTEAKADLKLPDGTTLLHQLPTPFLLFLEKFLGDLATFVASFPELDESFDWEEDEAAGLHRTQPIETQKMKKMEEALILHPPTSEHPAQTKAITRDVVIGYWTTTKLSGAMKRSKKMEILGKVKDLLRAAKVAREQANMTEVARVETGEAIFNHIFG